jgi:hypothetical protein
MVKNVVMHWYKLKSMPKFNIVQYRATSDSCIGRQDRQGDSPLASCPAGLESLFAACAAQRQIHPAQEGTRMPSKKQRIVVYCSPEEYTQISESAMRAGISLSAFMKSVCMGVAVPSLEHSQAVRDIVKANADLGRLGGLFKLALTEGQGDRFTLNRLLKDIDFDRKQLRAAAAKIQ